MIGIVIVSHSAKLAEGVVELAQQMGEGVAIAAAGGTGDGRIGTDPALILDALEAAYTDDGVLVLVDLGSAIMSTEMAVDLFDPDKAANVRVVSAPLVEGAIVAVAQAKSGDSLESIAAEARRALLPKIQQIGDDESPLAASPDPSDYADDQWVSMVLPVTNRLGLHLRPAQRIVRIASEYEADLRIRNATTGSDTINGKSLNLVSTLGAQQGHELEVSTRGPQAQALIEALQRLADDNFGDDDSSPEEARAAPVQPASDEYMLGIPAAPGIVIGAARPYQPRVPEVIKERAQDVEEELQKLTDALQEARAEIEELARSMRVRAGKNAADIFGAHLLFLEDEALLKPVRQRIRDSKLKAAYVWQEQIRELAQSYLDLESEYQRSRAQDVYDVGARVMRNLLGETAHGASIDEPGILVAEDLTPADTASLDPDKVFGIVTALGGATSHSAILARSLGIPALVGMGELVLNLDGETLILDAHNGRLYIEPEDDVLSEYETLAEEDRRTRADALAEAVNPAETVDGHRVEVYANIGSAADAAAAVEAGAEGVGLFRTEFLFLDRTTAPTEEEQVTAYRAAAAALDGRPMIIRTLDVGGDKPLPYLDTGEEANPFLGWRAIRVSLAQPDLFKEQLRAILRVAAEFPIKVMFPMIATVDEFRAAREMLDEARTELVEQGLDVPDSIETGMMIEIPSAAVLAERFAPEVDFFSVGTNDLTQYTLAAERGNPRLAKLGDAFQPAVLTLIKRVVDAAHAEGKWVGVCGELAGHPQAVPLLIGLGVDELSMSAPAIPTAKAIVRSLTLSEIEEQAAAALHLPTPDEIRAAFT